MKKCPDCEKELKPENMLCSCGYDFTKMDCPGCDTRIPDDSVTCPNCKYNLVEDRPFGRKPRQLKIKVEEKTVVKPIRNRKSKVYVPALFRMSNWSELSFSGPETDAGLLAWANKLRNRANEDNDWFSNHAVAYVAEHSDNKYLKTNCTHLRDLLGGDDWK